MSWDLCFHSICWRFSQDLCKHCLGSICQPIPYASKMSVDEPAATSVRTYTCDIGHRFDDGHRTRTTECDGLDWDYYPDECLSKYGLSDSSTGKIKGVVVFWTFDTYHCTKVWTFSNWIIIHHIHSACIIFWFELYDNECKNKFMKWTSAVWIHLLHT